MSIEWEESNSFLKKDVPYIPSIISDVVKVIAVGSFSESPMVRRAHPPRKSQQALTISCERLRGYWKLSGGTNLRSTGTSTPSKPF